MVEEEKQDPPFKIEAARSSRSKCKVCRRAIDKGKLRFGLMIDGPFGPGYLWHHLSCAARRMMDSVEEAWQLRAWEAGKEPVPEADLPSLESLRKLKEKAETKKQTRKELPYVDIAPTGRAKCKRCDEPFEKGSARVAVGRAVEFGRQMRTQPVNVHPRCVAEELASGESATEADSLEIGLRANSTDLADGVLDRVLTEIGDL